MALTGGGRSGAHSDPSVLVDLDPSVFAGVDRSTGPLDEGTEPDADRVAPVCQARLLVLPEIVQPDEVDGTAQRRRIVTRVIEGAGGGAVGERFGRG